MSGACCQETKGGGSARSIRRATAVPNRRRPCRRLARRARELGVKILTGCTVRGVETKAGRIATAVTEHGTIACSSVVLAGGAWSRLFCRNLDLTLPQLKVIASVMRVDGVTDGPESAALCSDFAFRKRADGGYTVTGGTGAVADIVPDSFRFFRLFVPLAAAERRHTRLRLGRRFVEEYRQATRWQLDEPSPFERSRILDPQPSTRELDAGAATSQGRFPCLQFGYGPPALGRNDRCDSRCDPRHFQRGQLARLLHCHRLLGPWLRHRTRRWPADGGHCHRSRSDRRSVSFPFLPLHRRIALELCHGVMKSWRHSPSSDNGNRSLAISFSRQPL